MFESRAEATGVTISQKAVKKTEMMLYKHQNNQIDGNIILLNATYETEENEDSDCLPSKLIGDERRFK